MRVVNAVVYILAQDDGLNPLISEQEAQMQIKVKSGTCQRIYSPIMFQIINKAFYPYNISLSATTKVFPSTFLLDRKVLPFCVPQMVSFINMITIASYCYTD